MAPSEHCMGPFDSETIDQAAILWSYMASFRSAAPCDAVVVCCSYDLRVCDFACDLINSGLSRLNHLTRPAPPL